MKLKGRPWDFTPKIGRDHQKPTIPILFDCDTDRVIGLIERGYAELLASDLFQITVVKAQAPGFPAVLTSISLSPNLPAEPNSFYCQCKTCRRIRNKENEV